MKPRERTIRVLLRILANPYRYTKRDLADHFNMSKDAISEYIDALVNAGLHFDQKKYKCAILPKREFKELQYLQSLNKEDRLKIGDALNRFASAKEALYLKKKLESLYNFQQLGLRALRRPHLDKIDILERAKKNKLAVTLEKYRSNSNSIKDRLVEPFLIDVELDTLQAYDVDGKITKHFRLSRIERVIPNETPWQYEKDHQHKYTDVFRIAENKKTWVHLRLQVYAYNTLIEHFPKAIGEITKGNEPNIFHFEANVNYKFKGLLNFIMGNFEQIEIVAPEELKVRVAEEAERILEKLKKN